MAALWTDDDTRPLVVGAGVTVAVDAPVATLRTVFADALASPAMRAAARRMCETFAAYDGAAAAEVVEHAVTAQARST